MLDAFFLGALAAPLIPLMLEDTPAYVVAGVAIVLTLLYGTISEGSRFGATPGKWILGLEVLDEHSGKPIGYRRALLRRVAYLAGAIPFYLGWLSILYDDKHRAWHDKVAHSIVTRAKSRTTR